MYDAYYYRPATEKISAMRLLWGMFQRKADAIYTTDKRFREPLNCATGCTTAEVVDRRTGKTVAYWIKNEGAVTRETYKN